MNPCFEEYYVIGNDMFVEVIGLLCVGMMALTKSDTAGCNLRWTHEVESDGVLKTGI